MLKKMRNEKNMKRDKFRIYLIFIIFTFLLILVSSLNLSFVNAATIDSNYTYNISNFKENFSANVDLYDTFNYNLILKNYSNSFLESLVINRSFVTKLDSDGIIDNQYDVINRTYLENSTIFSTFYPNLAGLYNYNLRLVSANFSNVLFDRNVEFDVLEIENESLERLNDENFTLSKNNKGNNITLNFSQSSVSLFFNETYYYAQDDFSIKILPQIKFNNEIKKLTTNRSISDNVYDFYNLTMEFRPQNSDRVLMCSLEIYNDSVQKCDLSRFMVEMTDYFVEGKLTYGNESAEFNTSFAVEIPNIDLTLDVKYDNFVSFNDEQKISVKTFISNVPVLDSQVKIFVTSPNGSKFDLDLMIDKNKTEYYSIFKPSQSGIHEIEVMAINGNNYDIYNQQFRVLEDHTSIRLDIPDKIIHNIGQLNFTGNITLLQDLNFITENVTLYYSRISREPVELCNIICNGFCSFSCAISGIVEYSDYEIIAEVEIDGRKYSTTENVSIVFDDVDIDIDLSYSKEYFVEQKKDFFFRPLFDDKEIDFGSAFVEIVDPIGITYRITPQKIYGGYAFSHVGLEPGNYFMNITFISEIGYTSQIFNYTVLENISLLPDEKRHFLISRDRNIRQILTESVLYDFNQSSEDTKILQLPSRLDNNISWIVISKNRSLNLEISQNFIPGSISRLRLSEYLSRSVYDDFRDFEIFYAETGPINFDTTILSEENKIIKILDDYFNYTDILLSFDFEGLSKVSKDRIIVKDLNRNRTISGISYLENENNLVSEISFIESILSSNYEIKLLIDEPPFSVTSKDRVRRQTPFVVSVEFLNKDVSIVEDSISCEIIINRETHEMIPSPLKNSYIHKLEFSRPGLHNYSVLCGSNLVEKSVMITEPRPIESISEKSSSIRKDDSSRVLMSYNSPQHYFDSGEWMEINTNFYPVKDSGLRNESSDFEYVADRGKFSVSLSSMVVDKPFIYKYDNDKISFALNSISLYNQTSGEILEYYYPNQNSIFYSENNKVIYEDVFGEGTSKVFTYLNSKLKVEIIFEKETHPLFSEFYSVSNNLSLIKDLDVILSYKIKTDNLRIDPQRGRHSIPIRNIDYTSSNIKIEKDYFYPKENLSDRTVMEREIIGDDGNYTMISKLSYSDFITHSNLIIDPSFTISDNNRDAVSVNNDIRIDYHSEESQYLRFGDDAGNIYETGLQFQLDVPYGSNILDAYVVFVAGQEQQGSNLNSLIRIEDTVDASPYIEGSGNISSRLYTSKNISWSIDSWEHGASYETPDISELIQDVVDNPSWESGNYIGLMLYSENLSQNSYRTIHGSSSPGSNLPVLILTYESSTDAPDVFLLEPSDSSHTNAEIINISYIPSDGDGLDSCELWGDFDGEWRLNQTENNPQANIPNSFELVLDEGEYLWNVWCSDIMGNAGFNESSNIFFVDRTPPSISLMSPIENDEIDNFNITFSFIVEDASPTLMCNLTYENKDIGEIFSVTDITVESYNSIEVLQNNIPVGEYNWNVSCVDLAGNKGISDNVSFYVSRHSNLYIESEPDFYSNFSVFEKFMVYANYSNSTGEAIEDSQCIIYYDSQFNEMDFNYSSGLHQTTISFTKPYNQTFEIECNSDFYDGISSNSRVYIYPVIHVAHQKSVSLLENGSYRIYLDFVNYHNSSSKVILNDYIPQGFNVSFSNTPINSNTTIYVGFIGKIYTWEFILDYNESSTIYYELIPSSDLYHASKLYMSSISSRMQD